MSGTAARLPRLLALVPYLLAHPDSHVRDVAAVFGVTERQLRVDLDLLWVCGLPGHGPGDLIDMSYEGDRVTLTNATSIARPLRLTADEALALVVALRTLANIPGLEERDALNRALVKLAGAAGAAVDGGVEGAAEERVQVSVEAEARMLATVRDAVDRRRRLHLAYHVPARDERTERDVDPMRVLLAEGRPYLEGWCRRVEAVRLFRLDRIVDVQVLDLPSEPPAEAQPRDLSEGLFQPSPADETVTLALAPTARWVADYYPCEEVTEREDGELVVRLRTPDTGWVRRLVLGLGPAGQVLDPPSLADQVEADARAALAAYGS